jgi:hypothetical protein
MKRLALIASALASLAALTACQNTTKAETAAAAPATVNKVCALMHDHPVDPALSVDYKGQKVGFCCDDCKVEWAGMSDAKRDAQLAGAITAGKGK